MVYCKGKRERVVQINDYIDTHPGGKILCAHRNNMRICIRILISQ